MVGTFTVAGREDRTPELDRYEIASVEKVGDDLWRFNAKMDCCGMAGPGSPSPCLCDLSATLPSS